MQRVTEQRFQVVLRKRISNQMRKCMNFETVCTCLKSDKMRLCAIYELHISPDMRENFARAIHSTGNLAVNCPLQKFLNWSIESRKITYAIAYFEKWFYLGALNKKRCQIEVSSSLFIIYSIWIGALLYLSETQSSLAVQQTNPNKIYPTIA